MQIPCDTEDSRVRSEHNMRVDLRYANIFNYILLIVVRIKGYTL